MFRRVVVALVLCSSVGAWFSSTAQARAVLSATPASGLWNVPVSVRAVGLPSGQHVTIRAYTIDSRRTRWGSSAEFVADRHGVIDLARQEPEIGPYTGTDASGLLSTLQPSANNGDDVFPSSSSAVFRFDVVERGKIIASARATRTLLANNVTRQRLTLAHTGVYGYYLAPRGTRQRTAVLLLGGSQGGLALPYYQASLLASDGIPSLAIAYFNEPGLPPTLDRIPLEYFVRAIHWLDDQPGVDPDRLVVWGVSRGSEAALLLGVHFSKLVHGVIALAPSSFAHRALGLGQASLRTSAWTLDGKQLPSGPDLGTIPVERIQGPVLTASGERDNVWSSSDYAGAIQDRLTRHHDRWPHTNYDYDAAGHGISIAVPDTAIAAPFFGGGGTLASNGEARAQLWPRLLQFLRAR